MIPLLARLMSTVSFILLLNKKFGSYSFICHRVIIINAISFDRQKELDTLLLVKTSGGLDDLSGRLSNLTDAVAYSGNVEIVQKFIESVKEKRTDLNLQESLSQEAANSLISTLKVQLEHLRIISSERTSWEERSVAAKLAQKLQKYQRNKRWRKKRRKLVAEKISKVRQIVN